MVRSGGVRRDGEHHNDNATDAIGDFLGDRDRIHILRLHPHAQTNEEAALTLRIDINSFDLLLDPPSGRGTSAGTRHHPTLEAYCR